MPNVKNFAYSTVATAPSPATSGTSLVVAAGDGTKFPSVSFNATIWPAGLRPTSANAEVVTVSNISTDTFTITRSAESSSARTVIVGDQIAATITGGLFPTGTIVGTSDAQTVSGKILSDTFMGKVIDTNLIKQSTTLEASTDYIDYDLLENSASYVLEVPATSTLEVVPIVKQAEIQSYFGIYDFIESGCVWTADSAGSTLNATMSDGYVWINGGRLRVNCVRSRAFTASRDTYVDFSNNGDGTAKVTYTENTNNLAAGSPALPTGSLRNAIVVSGAASIAAAASINQGQPGALLPIVSSQQYETTDSLGNLIYPRDPQRRILGYRQVTSNIAITNQATATNNATGLSCPVLVPTGRRIRITLFSEALYSNTNAASAKASILDVSTEISRGIALGPTTTAASTPHVAAIVTPTTSSKTYNGGVWSTGASIATFEAAATYPAYIMVELV